MKKFILSAFLCCFIAICGWTNPLVVLPAEVKSNVSKSVSILKFSEVKKILPQVCFDLTVWTVCGTVWQGDVCVVGVTSLTPQQMNSAAWNAIHQKDYQHCGYTA
jgi:hypothetical protein